MKFGKLTKNRIIAGIYIILLIVFSVSVMIACRLFLPDNEDEILDFPKAGQTKTDGPGR